MLVAIATCKHELFLSPPQWPTSKHFRVVGEVSREEEESDHSLRKPKRIKTLPPKEKKTIPKEKEKKEGKKTASLLSQQSTQ